MRILIIDNYDSFTYNLFHLVEMVAGDDAEICVFQNDKINLEQVSEFDKIILSPGPGLPKEAGIMMKLIEEFHTTKSIFGVCLGFQAIGEFFGSRLVNLQRVFHGVSTPIFVSDFGDLFAGLPEIFLVGRYHSWVLDKNSIPNTMKVTAVDSEVNVMAASHLHHDISGVQFHPESILSEYGKDILVNWLNKKKDSVY